MFFFFSFFVPVACGTHKDGHIRIIFKIKGIKTKHKHKRKLTLKVDKLFPVFLADYLENGKSMQHYADKYEVSKFALSKRLENYFKLRRL